MIKKKTAQAIYEEWQRLRGNELGAQVTLCKKSGEPLLVEIGYESGLADGRREVLAIVRSHPFAFGNAIIKLIESELAKGASDA